MTDQDKRPNAAPDSLHGLRDRLREFAAQRHWEQFHTPKNLAMSAAIEAAELMEHFQWLTPAQSASLADAQRVDVSHEIADVMLYLIRLADVLDIDPVAAAHEKIGLNALKYPVPGGL